MAACRPFGRAAHTCARPSEKHTHVYILPRPKFGGVFYSSLPPGRPSNLLSPARYIIIIIIINRVRIDFFTYMHTHTYIRVIIIL